MTPRRRLGRRLALALLAATLLAAAGGYAVVFHTDAGLAWAVARANALAPARLAIGAAKGTLAGPLELGDLRLALGASTVIEVRRLALDWQPPLLALGKLRVTTLRAEGVRVRVTPDPAAAPFRMPARLPLPLHVELVAAQAHDVELAYAALSPLVVDTLALAGGFDARGLWFERLDARGPHGRAGGAARMAGAAPYALDGRLELDVYPPDAPAVQARIELGGGLEDLELAAESAAPVPARLTARLADPFDARRLVARLESPGLSLATLDRRWPAVRLQGALDAAGSLAADGTLALDGRIEAHAAARPALGATFRGRLDRRRLALEPVELALAGLPTRVTARIGVDLTARPLAIDGHAAWRDLAAPRGRAPLPLSPRGRMDFAGTLDALAFTGRAAGPEAATEDVTLEGRLALRTGRLQARAAWPALLLPAEFDAPLSLGAGSLELDGTFAAPALALDAELLPRGLPPAALVARGALSSGGLEVATLEARWLDGRIAGAARVDWRTAPRWQARLRATGLDPGRAFGGFDGRIGAALALDGTLGADGVHATFDMADIDGRVRDQPLAGHARFAHDAGRNALRELELEAGAARLAASAVPGAGLRWDVDVPDLGAFLPGARGRVASRGHAAGTVAVPHLELALDAADLAWRDFKLTRLTARTAGEGDARTLVVAGDDFAAPGVALDGLRLELAGDEARHRGALAAWAEAFTFDARLEGGIKSGRWDATLAAATLEFTALGAWTLAAPARVSATRDELRLPPTCWSDGRARACVEGEYAREAWRVDAVLEELALAGLAPLLPAGLDYGGEFGGRVWARGGGAAPLAALAELDLRAGRVTQRRDGEALVLLGFDTGTARLALAGAALDARVSLDLPEAGRLEATLETRIDGERDARPLAGRLRGQTRDFALVPVLFPELRRFAGRLDADLALAGTLGAPRFAGAARFSDGVASIPRLGLDLADVELTLRGAGEELAVQGRARSGGELTWTGGLRRALDGWHGRVKFTGERFRALNVPEARVTVSPELEVRIAARDVAVNGTLRVPSARLAPRDLAGAAPVTPDQVIVGGPRTAGAAAPRWRLSTRLRTVLGDDVRFDGFGLRARVTGEIVATDTPEQLTVASGELAVEDGQYEAYGQELTIERGRLLFTGGPVTDPGLDIRATRLIEGAVEAENITVGVNIRGSLRRPVTSLFAIAAEPLSESDQLSLLVLGQKLQDTEAEDQQTLDEARNQMGITAGGALVARAIGRELGIEDVTVRGSGTEQAQLVLGKYLSPRLYLSYGFGLFTPVNTVRLRYRLGSKWSVEAESGLESSADFKYTIEK